MATVLRSQCAFARLFAGKTGQILNNSIDLGTIFVPGSQLVAPVYRKYSNYAQSPFVDRIKEQYNYEIVKNPPEWMYVERLLPFETIPQVQPKEKYPSGWIPPKEEAVNLQYFLQRTKNNEIPIYLAIFDRGIRKSTKVKKIEGDIWMMNDDIKSFLKHKNKRYVETRVHELAKCIDIKGDFVNDVREWALSKGF